MTLGWASPSALRLAASALDDRALRTLRAVPTPGAPAPDSAPSAAVSRMIVAEPALVDGERFAIERLRLRVARFEVQQHTEVVQA